MGRALIHEICAGRSLENDHKRLQNRDGENKMRKKMMKGKKLWNIVARLASKHGKKISSC